MEAGEKKELLDDQEDDEKAEGGGDEDGDDAVKVAGENKGDVESGDEDDDAEKGALVESPGKKSQVRNTVIQPLTERPSHLDSLNERTHCYLQGKRRLKLPPCAFKSESCARMWRETDTNKKIIFAAAITAILLLIFIIVSTTICTCLLGKNLRFS